MQVKNRRESNDRLETCPTELRESTASRWDIRPAYQRLCKKGWKEMANHELSA